MKKLLALLLVGTMALGLTACGGSGGAASSAAPAASEAPAESQAEAEAPAEEAAGIVDMLLKAADELHFIAGIAVGMCFVLLQSAHKDLFIAVIRVEMFFDAALRIVRQRQANAAERPRNAGGHRKGQTEEQSCHSAALRLPAVHFRQKGFHASVHV